MFEGEGKSSGTVSPIEHIDLAKWPDLIVIAPATQNTIAAFAHGRADDLLATVVSAYRGPVMLAPAMNDVMWENAATQENMRLLSERGFRVAPPEKGDLACGYEATGRMAEPETIFGAVETLFDSRWKGRRVLVSVGGTEEDIDPVRVISNRSSGKMGFAVAEAARDLGAEVTVVAARTSVAPPHGVRVVRVRTSEEMSRALHDAFDTSRRAGDDGRDLRLQAGHATRAEEEVGRRVDPRSGEDRRRAGIARSAQRAIAPIVGFALETENEENNARAKLAKKQCDLVVLNRPEVSFGSTPTW